MHWILWTWLLFQERPFEGEAKFKSLTSVRSDDLTRETLIDEARSNRQATSAETTRRIQAAVQEKQFLDRYNRLMKAMLQFAESYNDHHAIDAKLLQTVRKALVDLQKHDALFREARKE